MSEKTDTPPPVDDAETVAERVKENVRAHLTLADLIQRYALIGVWGVVILVFSVLPKTADTFLTTANFSSIFSSMAIRIPPI